MNKVEGRKSIFSSILLGSISEACKLNRQKIEKQERRRYTNIIFNFIHTGSPQKRSENWRRQLDLEFYVPFSKEWYIVEKWLDKGKGVWASRGSKLWEGRYRGKLMVEKGYSVRLVYTDSSQCHLPSLVIGLLSYLHL